MRLIAIFFLSSLLFINIAAADSWQKVYGGNQNEVSAGIAPAPDNGFVVAGFTQSSGAGKRDVWVVRFNSDGGVLWEKSYGTAADEVGTAISRIPAGGFVISGYEAVPNQTSTRPFLLRINDLGHIVWQKTFGDINFLVITSVAVTPDGHILAAGEHEHVHSGAWIGKFNLAGDILWQEKNGGNEQFLNLLQSVHPTADNEIIIAGQRIGISTTDRDRFSDIWVAKLTRSGKIRWQNRYGAVDRGEFGYKISQTANGDFLVAASQSNSLNNSEDIIILRLNSTGGIQWQKRFESKRNEDVRSIAEATNQNIFIGGRTEFSIRDTGVMLELNASGDLLHQRQFLNANFINAGMLFRSDGSLIAAGHSRSFPGKLADFWLLGLTSPFETGTCKERAPGLSASDSDLVANPTSHVPRKTNLKFSAGSFVEQDTHLASRVICSRKSTSTFSIRP